MRRLLRPGRAAHRRNSRESREWLGVRGHYVPCAGDTAWPYEITGVLETKNAVLNSLA
jgi:hypothetical protein